MFDLQTLPARRGVYTLHLILASDRRIPVGRLGLQDFPAGLYCYVGSAQGAGGLCARVGRHLRGAGTPHWHIDHLRAVAEVGDVFYTVTDKVLECVWSRALAQIPGAFIPVADFGSSDCRSGCAAHLIGFPYDTDLDQMSHLLARLSPTPIGCLRPTASGSD